MKTLKTLVSLFILFLFLFYSYPCLAQLSIIKIPSYNITSTSHSMSFGSDHIGFIATKNILYKTTNGGLNWSNVSLSFLSNGVTQVKLYNETIGCICTGDRNIYRTTDGGNKWYGITPALSSSNFNHVVFYSDNEFVVSNRDSLFHTTNGGLSWRRHRFNFNFSISPNITEMIRDDGNLYCTIYHNLTGSSLYKSTNRGQNWFSHFGHASYNFEQLQVINSRVVIGGKFYRDESFWVFLNSGTDNGFSYSTEMLGDGTCRGLELYPNGNGYSIIFAYNTTFMLVKTSNYGQNWALDTILTRDFTNLNLTNSKLFALNKDSGYVLIKSQTVGIEKITDVIPSEYKLSQNYPNPFNPVTRINFAIPKSGYVKLIVYNISGELLERLFSGTLNAGIYEYHFDAKDYASGIYFYTLETENFVETKRMVLVK